MLQNLVYYDFGLLQPALTDFVIFSNGDLTAIKTFNFRFPFLVTSFICFYWFSGK